MQKILFRMILFLTFSIPTISMAQSIGCPSMETLSKGKFFYAMEYGRFLLEGSAFEEKNERKIHYVLMTEWFSAANKKDALTQGNRALNEKHFEFAGAGGNNCYYRLFINDQKVQLSVYDEMNP